MRYGILASQLARENRKFIYKVVKTALGHANMRRLLWREAGMIQGVNTSNRASPECIKDISAFKVYAADCGLLRVLAKVSRRLFWGTQQLYKFRRHRRNAVLIIAAAMRGHPVLLEFRHKAEVDFVAMRTDIIPVEVKSEHRVSGKSLSVYNKKFAPRYRIRFSSNNLQLNDGLLSCPLPLADWVVKWLDN